MPKDKTETHRKILPAAMEEFLEKGFEGATMRGIAEKAGITAAGLYRHFFDKEAMFSALVDPVLEECRRWAEGRKQQDYDFLVQDQLDTMWDGQGELQIIELLYAHFQEFKLLLCCSAGTKYMSFLHDCTMMQQKETFAYLEAARQKGVPVREVDPLELHLLMTAYTNAIFEVVVHDFSREQALHYIKTLQEFFYPGWRAVLGL